MIAVVGIMIGFYIITRMAELIDEKGSKHGFLNIMAIITILVALYAIGSLIIGSVDLSQYLK